MFWRSDARWQRWLTIPRSNQGVRHQGERGSDNCFLQQLLPSATIKKMDGKAVSSSHRQSSNQKHRRTPAISSDGSLEKQKPSDQTNTSHSYCSALKLIPINNLPFQPTKHAHTHFSVHIIPMHLFSFNLPKVRPLSPVGGLYVVST